MSLLVGSRRLKIDLSRPPFHIDLDSLSRGFLSRNGMTFVPDRLSSTTSTTTTLARRWSFHRDPRCGSSSFRINQ